MPGLMHDLFEQGDQFLDRHDVSPVLTGITTHQMFHK